MNDETRALLEARIDEATEQAEAWAAQERQAAAMVAQWQGALLALRRLRDELPAPPVGTGEEA